MSEMYYRGGWYCHDEGPERCVIHYRDTITVSSGGVDLTGQVDYQQDVDAWVLMANDGTVHKLYPGLHVVDHIDRSEMYRDGLLIV